MLVRAHMAIGGAVGLAVTGMMAGRPSEVIWAVPVGVIAGGLADVLDTETAAGREPLGLSWSGIKRTARRRRKSLVEGLLLLPRAVGAFVLDLVAQAIPHRGLTHWLFTWLLLSILVVEVVLLVGWNVWFGAAFALGYLSHLLADGMTVSGVPFLGPFYNKPLHLLPRPLRFRFDSPMQWLVVLAVWGLVLWRFYPAVVTMATVVFGGWR